MANFKKPTPQPPKATAPAAPPVTPAPVPFSPPIPAPIPTALAVPDDSLLAEMAADSGAGFEEATKDNFALPFLVVLQDLSPQTKSKMTGYIEGAQPGMICNTVSQRVYRSLKVIPCYFSSVLVEWIPRDKGGGFVGAHPPDSPLLKQATRDGARNVLPNGHELQLTAQHFVLTVEEDGSTDGVLMALKSTQLKYSRRWMTMMRAAVIEARGKLIQAPMYSYSYMLSSEEEANDQGSWHSWRITDREMLRDRELFHLAKAFAETMRAGNAKINYEEMQTMGDTHDVPPADLDNEIDA